MKTDISIISSFGRGNWLSTELSQMGFKVKLVDVSSSMGRWAPEDWEGPFGFFHLDSLKPTQLERLNEEDYYEPVDEGFTVWLKNGPVDLKGPLASHILEKSGLKEIADKYLTDNQKKYDADALMKEGFDKTWLVFLAHHLASNRFRENNFEITPDMKKIPLFSTLNVRRVSRRGADKSLEWCKTKSVEVLKDAQLVDLSVENKKISSLEVKSDSFSGTIESDHFIWMLTSEETRRFPEVFSKSLFPSGVLKSSWSWLRYRVQLGADTDYTASLPIKFLMIEDLYLPWAHENLAFVQRAVTEKHMDVWMRVPQSQRFQRDYVQDLGDKLLKIFTQRIPNSKPEVIDMPQDYMYDEAELGPSRFPMFDPDELSSHKFANYKNLIFESPEKWSPQDWSGQFSSQEKCIKKYQKIKQQEVEQ